MLKEGPIWALGAMSGTSLDGVDAAMLKTDGHAILEFGASDYIAYDDGERAILRDALGKWGDVDAATQVVEAAHLTLLAGFDGVDLVGFHGQTLAHEPAGRGTFQTGDGAWLAKGLGLPVVWDFRSADVQLGGQGAPLAPFFHFACAKWISAQKPLCFLNLGGVGNISWVDPSRAAPQDEGAMLAFDTGPANAPLDDLMMQRTGESCDRDGRRAASGIVSAEVLESFSQIGYFLKIPPKSLDRNDFVDLLAKVSHLSLADAAATLTACIAAAASDAMTHLPQVPERVLVCGGGRKNPILMAMLSAAIDCPVEPVEVVGLDGDMLEAQAFAYLAVRVAKGLTTSCPGTTGVSAAVGGGTVSYP